MNRHAQALERMAPDKLARVANVAALMERAFEGHIPSQHRLIQEAISTSDFPAIFQTITNISIERAVTTVAPPLYPAIAKKTTLSSLKKTKWRETSLDLSGGGMFAENGGENRLPASLPMIPELSGYPTLSFAASEEEVGLDKFGGRIAFSWEAWQNDDLGVIASLPTELVKAANMTKDMAVFRQLFVTAGWATTLNSRKLSGNPVLSLTSLEAALGMAAQVPSGSELRINTINSWTLVVPPELQLTAQSLIKATDITRTGTDSTVYKTANPISGLISQVLVLPYVPLLSPSMAGGQQGKWWGIFPTGGNGSDRTTLAALDLAGNETPELRIRNDQGAALGGGSLDGYAGSFDNDDVQIRVRSFAGAALLDTLGIVISEGDGS